MYTRSILIAIMMAAAVILHAPVTAAATELTESYEVYIGWRFTTHDEPSHTAKVRGRYSPQSVRVITANADGWGLIETDKGHCWTYLQGDLVYIDKHTSLYNSQDGAETVGIISPQVVRVIERAEPWLLIETWMGNKWLDQSAFRRSVLMDVPILNQRALGYPTGCEIISLGMLINYSMEADIRTLVSKMPRSADPNAGFRGDPTTEYGFTVFPQGLTALTAEYLGNAVDMTGCEIEDLKRQLNAGYPVVVWINGLGFNVHAFCLTGYDENGFYYNDPWYGRKNAFMSYANFYSVWNKPVYDKQFNISYPVRQALSYSAEQSGFFREPAMPQADDPQARLRRPLQ